MSGDPKLLRRPALHSHETLAHPYPKLRVILNVGPELAQDQSFDEVYSAHWHEPMNEWVRKREPSAYIEWNSPKDLGSTSVEVHGHKGASPAVLERHRKAIEKKLYETAHEAVERVRAEWAEWERESKKFRTGLMPDFRKEPACMYTTMIRGPHDPERKAVARSLAKKGQKVVKPLGWRKILKMKPEASMRQIVSHLADGKPRTFNAISVETIDQTADHTVGTPYEEGLWMGTLNELIGFTNQAPILFRITAKGKRWLKAGAKPLKQPKRPNEVMGYEKGIHPYQQEEEDEE